MTGEPSITADWMGSAMLTSSAPNGPYAAGSTPVYTGQLLDAYGAVIPASHITVLTLTLVDTLTGAVVNGVNAINILNTGRGTVDALGNLTIAYLATDTAITEGALPSIQRSAVIDWTFTGGVGRHQVDFKIFALAGA